MGEFGFIILGLIVLQVLLSVYGIAIHHFILLGFNSLSLVIFGGLISTVFFLPFALLEKRNWPNRLKPTLLIQVFLMSMGGIVMQFLLFYGMKMTSPSLLAATPNLGPIITFIVATCTKLESFSIWCKYSRLKVIGTILCLSGAIAMSSLMSALPTTDTTVLPSNGDWILGSFYLLVSIIIGSCTGVWQAHFMVGFPAPFSLCIMGGAMSSIVTIVVQFIMEGNLSVGAPSVSFWGIVGIIFLIALQNTICVGYLTWSIKKVGPVIVSIFSPVQTMCSTILTAITLHQAFGPGCLSGMLLMFIGLYIFLWAKKKESCIAQTMDNEKTYTGDIEKPLLS